MPYKLNIAISNKIVLTTFDWPAFQVIPCPTVETKKCYGNFGIKTMLQTNFSEFNYVFTFGNSLCKYSSCIVDDS